MERNTSERADVERTNVVTDMRCDEGEHGDKCRHVIRRNSFLESPTAGETDERTLVTESICPVHGLNPDRVEPLPEKLQKQTGKTYA